MRVSLPVPSEQELAKEHAEMREGLTPSQKRDLEAHIEREKAERDKLTADRQALYDRKQI